MALSSSLAPQTLANLPVFRAATLGKAKGGGSWRFDNLIGILAEVSEEKPSGAVSFAAEIIVEAQAQNEPVAWVAGTESIFFPPDLQERGVDLSAVAVVRVNGETDSLTAAEWLVRSGAMGLVIVDLGERGNVDDASLGRLLKLAERNLCAVLFLTRKRCTRTLPRLQDFAAGMHLPVRQRALRHRHSYGQGQALKLRLPAKQAVSWPFGDALTSTACPCRFS